MQREEDSHLAGVQEEEMCAGFIAAFLVFVFRQEGGAGP